MSFATRLCANLLKGNWSSQVAAGSNNVCRNFHSLMRPQVPATTNSLVEAVAATTSRLFDGASRLLAPRNPLVTQVAGFKVKGRLKPRCKDCYYVIRQQRHYIICPTHPRHKQMSMKKRDYKSWILTHATQSKERGF